MTGFVPILALISVAVFVAGLFSIAVVQQQRKIKKGEEKVARTIESLGREISNQRHKIPALKGLNAEMSNKNVEFADKMTSLRKETVYLRSSLEIKDAEGWDLTAQIRFKADELHHMALQLTEQIADNQALEREIQERNYHIEEYASLVHDQNIELVAIHRNTACTIHALTSQVQEVVQAKNAWEKYAKYLFGRLENLSGLQAQTISTGDMAGLQGLMEYYSGLIRNGVALGQDDVAILRSLAGLVVEDLG